jgi:hypothetical protein
MIAVNLSTPASTPETQPQPSSSEPATSSIPTQEFTSSISLEQPSNALPTSINTVTVSSLGIPSSIGIPDSGVSALTPPSSSRANRTKLEVFYCCWFSVFFHSRLLPAVQHCAKTRPTISWNQTHLYVKTQLSSNGSNTFQLEVHSFLERGYSAMTGL